jgi:MazG family protein
VSSFEDLIQTVKALRAPDGCPWDKEQTFKTLTPYILEEAYELVDAIENGTIDDMKEELGDALLHVVMLSNMAEEGGHFSVYDVADYENKKMIHRHPHVFGDTKVDSVDDVWKNWEALKKEEKEDSDSIMDTIPKTLPALLQASKLQKRASRVGFDWPDMTGPFDKIREEIQELETAHTNNDRKNLEEEAGDVLFAIVNVLRKLKINPEEALRHTNEKFKSRFKHMESSCKDANTELNTLSLDEQEALWVQAKQDEKA